MQFRYRLFRALRKLHLTVGLASALYFMMIAATGVAINHREGWHLDGKYIPRSVLPSSYRPDDGIEVRADIVVSDLHSGLIFGKLGAPVMDVVATVWFLSILSGIFMLSLRRKLNGEMKQHCCAANGGTKEPATEKQPVKELAGVGGN